MNQKSVILLQGPIYAHCIDMLCDTISKYPNTIISTWATTDPILLAHLQGAHIILSDFPWYSGVQNINAANKSICAGIDAANKLGYTHVLRFRTDYLLTDFSKYIDLCHSISHDKLVFMGWYNHDGGYLLDHVIYGPLELVRKYRSSEQAPGDTRYTEKFLQETYFGLQNLTFSDVCNKVAFSSKQTTEAGIKLYRLKESIFCTYDDMALYAANSTLI